MLLNFASEPYGILMTSGDCVSAKRMSDPIFFFFLTRDEKDTGEHKRGLLLPRQTQL